MEKYGDRLNDTSNDSKNEHNYNTYILQEKDSNNEQDNLTENNIIDHNFTQKQINHLNHPLKLNFNYETRYRLLMTDNDTLREQNINLKKNYERERVNYKCHFLD